MRIVVIHNFYGSAAPSGENAAVAAEIEELRRRGAEVLAITRSSDEIRGRGMLGAAAGGLAWMSNRRGCRRIRAAAQDFAPHVIHVHNTFPLISNGIFRALRGLAPRVLSLHNYRLVCPAAIPLRQGLPCTLCIEARSGWPGVWHRCYRGSAAATLPLALRATIDRALGTWTHEVEAFIVLSQFQKRLMARGGLPADKMHVRANPYFGTPRPVPWSERGNHVVYVGRLANEKGVLDLIEAWRMGGPHAPCLRVIGEGPARSAAVLKASGLPVTFLGSLPREAALEEIARASMVVVPSRCFEGFPLVIGEALAHGTPLAVADVGPLGDIVRTADAGGCFAAANPAALWSVVSGMWQDGRALERSSMNAQAAYRRDYTAEAASARLFEIYARAGVPPAVLDRLA